MILNASALPEGQCGRLKLFEAGSRKRSFPGSAVRPLQIALLLYSRILFLYCLLFAPESFNFRDQI